MAVAPATVEMGPRNRRRLTTTMVTVATVALLALFGRWFLGGVPFGHWSGANRASAPAGASVIRLIPQKNLPFGMTKKQILRRLGPPQKVAGQCWQYPENIKNFAGQTINAVRLCFWGNQYATWYMERDGVWRTSAVIPTTVPPPTKP